VTTRYVPVYSTLMHELAGPDDNPSITELGSGVHITVSFSKKSRVGEIKTIPVTTRNR